MKYISKTRSNMFKCVKWLNMLLLIILVSSCSDSVLDIKPAGNISETDIFSNANLLKFYVNGRYYSFQSYDFGLFNTDPMSDDWYASSNGEATNYKRGLSTSSSGIPLNNWATDYSLIRDANFFFSRIDGNTIEDKDAVKVLTGEMRFIRAWLYADLINLYGDVILLTDLPDLGQENFDMAKTPYQEVADFVVTELDKAIEELPNISFNGRASKGAALALKARVLLYSASPLHNNGAYDTEKLKKARDAAQTVVGLGTYSLEPDYGNIYKTPSYSNEIIFAKTFDSNHIPFNLFGVTSADRYYLPYAYQDVDPGYAQPLQSLVDSYEMTNGKYISESGSGYSNQNPYAGRDPRLNKTIIHQGSILAALPGVTDSYDNGDGTVTIRYDKDKAGDVSKNGNSYTSLINSGYNIFKRARPGQPMRGIRDAYQPWIYIRLAEMYLIVAEAETELGNSAQAMTALNVVRKRAGMPDVSGLSGDALRMKYRNERRVEFACENMRWFDITRWMIAPDVLNKTAYGVDIIRDNSLTQPVDTYSYNTRVLDNNFKWEDKMYYMPIPFSEIQANKLLVQNPGYTN